MKAGSPELGRLLQVALEVALEAGAITMRQFGSVLAFDAKDDGSPVTESDRAAETLLRDRIGRQFPHHGILGEEFGETNPGAAIRWVLDPIDGTRSFQRGVPLYGVLIGIEVEGTPSVGVAHFPALGETVGAALGHGCLWNQRIARVSTVRSLSDAAVLTSDLAGLFDRPEASGWERIVRESALARTWGDCYGHILVATGRAEIMLDPVLAPWDAAPFLPILREAGGRFTDLEGKARLDGGSGISTNGLLHERVLALLRGD